VAVTSAFKGDKLDESIPIDLEEFGELVKIKLQGCGKYAGLIRLPVLRKLLGDITVQISATLVQAAPEPSESVRKKGSTLWHSYTARIVFSGLKKIRLELAKCCPIRINFFNIHTQKSVESSSTAIRTTSCDPELRCLSYKVLLALFLLLQNPLVHSMN
jgi:hypothetical protein